MRAQRWVVAPVLALAVVAGTALSDASAQVPAPARCSTFNASSEPASVFAPGEPVSVRGTGFGPRSVVLLRLEQGTRSVELAKATANDLGAFRARGAEIPETVVAGKASIRALDARGSAVCNVTVKGSATDDPSGLGVLYVVWGLLLAAFGAFLAVITYRRWKAERLREAMEGFGLQPLLDDDIDEEDGDDERDAAVTARGGRERRRVRVRDADDDGTDTSSESADDFADEWAFREYVPAGWVREGSRSHARSRAIEDDVAWDEPVDDETWQPRSNGARADNAHTVLDDDRGAGRIRDRRHTSDLIARLRREVRSWKRL